ncbi:hypothetical protein PC114_g1584 [Phytophthora cactorum]|nr:hypothetical protein PC114_g1584 [Phytophthora cactorum]
MLQVEYRSEIRAPSLIFKQPPSRVEATKLYNRAYQNEFDRDL